MRILSFFFLATLIQFSSCDKQTDEMPTTNDLIGRWEDKGTPTRQFLFDNIYANAFELRKNKAFEVYYWHNGQPDEDRSTGRWFLMHDNELILEYNSRQEICTITQYDGKTMTIAHQLSGEIHKMTRK